jgi:hypothetical protein
MRQRLDLLARVGRLVHQCARAPAAHDEMRFDSGVAQPFEQLHAINHARGAGDADD